jgi:hypothetical protein
VLEKVYHSREVISQTPIIEQQCFKLAKHRAQFQIHKENRILEKMKRVTQQFKMKYMVPFVIEKQMV